MQIMRSIDPATGECVWEGGIADRAGCDAAIARGRATLPAWADTPLDERIAIARRYAAILRARSSALAETIARETGKLLWECTAEVASMVAKVDVSIDAQAERAGSRDVGTAFGRAVLRHRPHGVMLVLGPYNFPGHLPNGHIVPALLAGNSVVFKPSEETPATGEAMADAWQAAGLPTGVLQVVQGRRETGAALAAGDIDGLLFTGSAATGAHFRRAFIDRPGVILALEMGGNNPLIAWDGEPEAMASIIVHSAFITTGQRCSCARRLIVPEGAVGDRIVDAVTAIAANIAIGAWNEDRPTFMGPLISGRAARHAHAAVRAIEAAGACTLLPLTLPNGRGEAFVSAAVIDTTDVAVADHEIFAPVLQVCRVADFDAAIAAANATAYGLSAGMLSLDPQLWTRFRHHARAGIINWNRPTTGAAATMPFGGLGLSGNHRPSAYYAADYCAYPVGSFEAPQQEVLAVARDA